MAPESDGLVPGFSLYSLAMSIFLPEEIQTKLQIQSMIEEKNRMHERHGFLKYFNSQLKQIDPLLELVKATENANPGYLIPGCWHIRRNNETTVPTYYPIVDEDGNYKDPDMGDLERLRQMDMQREGAFDEMIERKKREGRARIEAMREEFRQEFADTYRTMNTPSILVRKKITSNG